MADIAINALVGVGGFIAYQVWSMNRTLSKHMFLLDNHETRITSLERDRT